MHETGCKRLQAPEATLLSALGSEMIRTDYVFAELELPLIRSYAIVWYQALGGGVNWWDRSPGSEKSSLDHHYAKGHVSVERACEGW